MSQNEFTEFRKKIIYLLGFHVKSKKLTSLPSGCGYPAGRMSSDPQINKHALFTKEIVTRWLVAGLGLITATHRVMKEEVWTLHSHWARRELEIKLI